MGKRLTTQTQIKRLRAEGYSRKDIARITNSSVSAVGRAERGETKNSPIAAPVREFFKLTKKAKANVVSGAVPLPSAKPAPTTKRKPSRIIESVTPLERAAGQLAVQDSDAMLVVQVTMKGAGKSRTLFARGGTSKAHLQSDLRGVIAKQYGVQYGDVDGGVFYWEEVMSIDIEEY